MARSRSIVNSPIAMLSALAMVTTVVGCVTEQPEPDPEPELYDECGLAAEDCLCGIDGDCVLSKYVLRVANVDDCYQLSDDCGCVHGRPMNLTAAQRNADDYDLWECESLFEEEWCAGSDCYNEYWPECLDEVCVTMKLDWPEPEP